MLYKLVGIRSSNTRCYRVGYNKEARHLKSTGKFPDLQKIQEAVRENDETGILGIKSVLFVHTEHLPDDLLSELDDLVTFHRFCEVVAFTSIILEAQPNPFELPTDRNDSNATYLPLDGFGFPMPTNNVDLRHSLSFGVEEAKEFLGDFFPYAGKLIFLALNNREGVLTVQDYKRIIPRAISWDLMRSSTTSLPH